MDTNKNPLSIAGPQQSDGSYPATDEKNGTLYHGIVYQKRSMETGRLDAYEFRAPGGKRALGDIYVAVSTENFNAALQSREDGQDRFIPDTTPFTKIPGIRNR